MEACARCFLSLWRVARRTLQASGLCVEFPCLVCFSRSVLRSVCPGLVTLRDTTCRPQCADTWREFGASSFGRGSKQRGLEQSEFGNPHKVSVFGRSQAVRRYEATLARGEELRGKVWSLAGCRLVCHCTPEQECHADIVVEEHRRSVPGRLRPRRSRLRRSFFVSSQPPLTSP